MEPHETQGDYWGFMRLSETHETQGDYLGIMRLLILLKTKGDSLDSERLLGTHETHENQRLIGTHVTQGDSWGLMGQNVYCGLMRPMRIIETPGDS